LRKNSCLTLKNRILAFFTALLIALNAASVSVPAAECTDRPDALSFSFLNTGNTADISAVCYYTDEYFRTPGTLPDPHLRTMSMAMSLSAFESYRDTEDYTGRCENFDNLMTSAGFTDLAHNKAYDEKPTEDSIGIAAAGKKVRFSGTEYTLIAIGIRGACYGSEWANNMRVGASGQAEGFSSAKVQVLEFLSTYEKERGITDHAKIWITGFSRGGAVADLAAAELNKDPSSYATSAEDIYCYTFEAPQGEEISSAGQYRNIHNTVSPADPVPLIPLSEWGLTRIGYTQEGRAGLYSQDDGLLPSPEDPGYEKARETMLSHLAKINPDISYTIDSFYEVRFDIWNKDQEAPLTQCGFIRSFISWINTTLPDKNRASYAENYQEAFSTLGRIFPPVWYSQEKQLSDAFKAAVKDPRFYAAVAGASLIIRLRGVMDENDYRSRLKDASYSIADNLIGHMKEQNVDISEEDYRAFADALAPVILFADAAIEDDITSHGGYYLATALSNLDNLIQGHSPEVILAWTEAFDSYYTPSLRTPHQLEHIEHSNASCTADGHKEYWECSVCGSLYTDPDASVKTVPEEILIPARGHDWDKGAIKKPATIYSNGVMVYTCRNCGRTHTESIEKLPFSLHNLLISMIEKRKSLAGN